MAGASLSALPRACAYLAPRLEQVPTAGRSPAVVEGTFKPVRARRAFLGPQNCRDGWVCSSSSGGCRYTEGEDCG